MTFGPDPWLQRHWDARAAINFMAGGAGGGLIVATVLAAPGSGRADAWPLLLGAGLVGAGLFAVWLEIGRPLRALNVFRHLRRSWMARESIAALVLMAAVAASFAWPGAQAVAAPAALVFVFCQGAIVRAAKGIPAWREPLIVPLMVGTALAEGAGLWCLLHAGEPVRPGVLGLLLLALVARLALWPAWRGRLRAAPRALAALDSAGRVFNGCTLAAGALALVASLSPPSGAVAAALPLAGALSVLGGQWFKFALIRRAGFNQGFGLPHLPVRGVPRVPSGDRR